MGFEMVSDRVWDERKEEGREFEIVEKTSYDAGREMAEVFSLPKCRLVSCGFRDPGGIFRHQRRSVLRLRSRGRHRDDQKRRPNYSVSKRLRLRYT